ncbi:MAG: hypothetical protein WCO96_06470 [Actinomycetes bacterium]
MPRTMPPHRRLAAWAVTGPPGRAVALVVDLGSLAVTEARRRLG